MLRPFVLTVSYYTLTLVTLAPTAIWRIATTSIAAALTRASGRRLLCLAQDHRRVNGQYVMVGMVFVARLMRLLLSGPAVGACVCDAWRVHVRLRRL